METRAAASNVTPGVASQITSQVAAQLPTPGSKMTPLELEKVHTYKLCLLLSSTKMEIKSFLHLTEKGFSNYCVVL